MNEVDFLAEELFISNWSTHSFAISVEELAKRCYSAADQFLSLREKLRHNYRDEEEKKADEIRSNGISEAIGRVSGSAL